MQNATQNSVKSGFVNILGRTNSGKSSLLNYLLGEKIAFVSHKQNATRRKVAGIVMFEGNQIIFVDTPGLNKSERVMNKLMNEAALKAVGDCDLVLFCASVFDDTSDYEKFLALNPPQHIIALTKTDLATQEKTLEKLSHYAKFSEKFSAILPVSVKKATYKNQILRQICQLLPTHPHFYDEENLSTATTKEIIRDFILEAVFECVSQEIPYYTDAKILKVTEGEELVSVQAQILTDTNSHKAILIGKQAQTIKRIGIKARKLIATLLRKSRAKLRSCRAEKLGDRREIHQKRVWLRVMKLPFSRPKQPSGQINFIHSISQAKKGFCNIFLLPQSQIYCTQILAPKGLAAAKLRLFLTQKFTNILPLKAILRWSFSFTKGKAPVKKSQERSKTTLFLR